VIERAAVIRALIAEGLLAGEPPASAGEDAQDMRNVQLELPVAGESVTSVTSVTPRPEPAGGEDALGLEAVYRALEGEAEGAE
jgi:hypothetical protein